MGKIGTTVGRVNVKVFPDTSNFRSDLERQLDRIERGLLVTIETELDTKNLDREARSAVEALNRRNYTVEINTDLDTKGLHAEAERAARALDDKIQEGRFRLSYDPEDFASVERAIRRVDDKLNERRLIHVDIDADEDSLRDLERRLQDRRRAANLGIAWDPSDIDDMRRALSEIDALATRERRVDMQVTLENLEERRRELQDLVEDYDNKQIELEVQAQTLVARAELARAARDRIVNLYVRVNQASLAAAGTAIAALAGGRLITSTLDNLREMFENLDKNIPLIGSIALAVAGLSAWLLAAASNTFALARSLAQMFGAGLALPGLLTGIAFGIGATIAVMKDFNSELPEIKTAFHELQNVMSIQFWGRVRGPMRELANTLLPQLSRGLVGTAGALGTFFANLADSMERNFQRSLPGMFRDLNDSIAISAGFTEVFASNLEILGRHGANYLPRLAQWWGRLNEQLNRWLRINSATGRLQGFIELGIFQIREFGRAVRGLWGVLSGLGRAAEAAGGSTLSILADTLESMSRVINGANFQTLLTDALRGAHDAMSAIAHRSGPATKRMFEELARTMSGSFVTAGNAIGDLLDGIFAAIAQPEFQNGLASFLEGLRVGILTLTPAFGPLGQALGRIGELAGNLAIAFGPLLNVLFTQLADLAIRLAPSLERLVFSLSGLLLNVLDGVGPTIVALADAFGRLAAAVPAPALVLGLVGAFAAFKAVIAGVWLAKNLRDIATGLGFMVMQMRTFRAQHGGFVTAVGKVGKVAGVVGAALLALGAISVVTTAFGRAQTTSVQQFSSAISDLDKSLEELTSGLQTLSPTQALSGLFSLESTAGWLPGLTVRIRDLSDALDWATGSSGFERTVLSLGETLGMIENPIRLAQEQIAAFDAALAMAVNSGNLDQAKRGAALFTQAMLAQGKTISEANALLPGYRDSLLQVAQAEEEAAREAARSAERIEHYNSAIQQAGGISAGAIQGINDASKAFIDFSEGLDDAELSLEGWIRQLEAQVQAQVRWADNMAELSRRGITDALRQELESLGPAGARFVQDLVNAGDGADRQLARLEAVVQAKGEGAAHAAESSFGQISAKVRAAIATLPADVRAELQKTHPEFFKGGQALSVEVAEGVRAGGASIRSNLQNSILDAVPGASMLDSTFSPTGRTIADAIAGAVSVRGGAINREVDTAIERAVPGSGMLNSLFGSAGSRIASETANGIQRNSHRVRSAGSALMGAARAGAAANSGGWNVLGIMAVAGLAKGINGNLGVARAAGAAAASAALGAAQYKLSIKSPSREFMRLGEYSVEGFAIGLSRTGSISQAASDLAESVLRASERQADLYSQGAQLGRSYADGIASEATRARLAAEALRDGVGLGVGDDLSANLRSVNAQVTAVRSGSSEPQPVYFPDGAEMTLMVDGQPMKAIIRQGAQSALEAEGRDFYARRGGY